MAAVAAAPDGDGGWQLAVIRHGQLAAAATAGRGVPPMPVVDAIGAGAQMVLPQPAPLGGALVEETALIARAYPHDRVRVSFAVPWEGMLLLGTTDTPHDGEPESVTVTDEDVEQEQIVKQKRG